MSTTLATMASTRSLLAAERADFAALLADLSEEEWDTPSLCEGWRVREIVGHLLYDSIPALTYAGICAKGRFGVDRINDELAAKAGALPTDDLLRRFETQTNTMSRFVPWLVLADTLVHHQDVRRPLGRPRTIPEERLVSALNRPDPLSFPGRRTQGLRFVATDLDWAKGEGPEVRGTGEALALAIGGRPVVLPELEGDGVGILRRRVQS